MFRALGLGLKVWGLVFWVWGVGRPVARRPEIVFRNGARTHPGVWEGGISEPDNQNWRVGLILTPSACEGIQITFPTKLPTALEAFNLAN